LASQHIQPERGFERWINHTLSLSTIPSRLNARFPWDAHEDIYLETMITIIELAHKLYSLRQRINKAGSADGDWFLAETMIHHAFRQTGYELDSFIASWLYNLEFLDPKQRDQAFGDLQTLKESIQFKPIPTFILNQRATKTLEKLASP
jgi:hypothetical protein